MANLQRNVFFFRAEVQGQIFADNNENGVRDRRENGIAGVAVELLTDDGDVVASALTDRNGRYGFNDFHETGDYQVRIADTSELQLTTADTLDLLISRGHERVRDMNFGVSVSGQPAEDNQERNGRNRPIRHEEIVDELFGREDPFV